MAEDKKETTGKTFIEIDSSALNDLEMILEINRTYKNEVKIPTGENSYFIYEAKAKHLAFSTGILYRQNEEPEKDMNFILGKATLTKYLLDENRKRNKKKKIWSFSSRDGYGLFDLFIKYGEICKDSDYESYRRTINKKLLSKGIVVSKELFDMAFDPIDEHLLKIYKKGIKKND